MKKKIINQPSLPLICGIIIVLLKVLIIDIDLPNWKIAYYQPLDEAYYVYKVINLFHTGSLDNLDKTGVFGVPIFTNVVTYFSLLIFGNNYTGLRFSSLVFAIISVVFFYLILKKMTQKKLLIWTGVLLLAINYPFTLSNIVVEPTIARIATGLITLYLLMRWSGKGEYSNKSVFVLSTVCTLLWIFTYPTNVFVLLALSIIVFTYGDDKLINRIKRLIPLLSGILLSTLVYYLFCMLMGDNLLETASRSGQQYGNRVGFTLQSLYWNFMNIFRANIFRFNALLLFLSIVSIPVIIRKQRRSMFQIPMIPFIFYTCFIIQCFFINDYPQRKLIFLLPFVILLIIQFFELTMDDSSRLVRNSILLGISFIVFFLLNKHGKGMGQFLFSITGMLCVIVFMLIKKYRKFSLCAIISLLLIIECYSTYKYTLKSMTKYYKEAFQSLDKYKNKKIIGGFAYGFTLYNTNTAYYNLYRYNKINNNYHNDPDLQAKVQKLAKESSDIDYTISYETDSVDFKYGNFERVEIIIPKEILISSTSIKRGNMVLYREKTK
jgi:4-amino-4-deoxy-L-arabinose transferase-like glycosyltransferase